MIHCRRRANVQTEAHATLPARSRRWVLWAVLATTLAAVPAHAQPYVYALGYEPTPDSAYTRLVAIDASTNGIVGSVVLGENPAPRNEHLAISPDGSRLVVVNNPERTVSVISAQTLALLDTYSQALLGIRPAAVTVSSDSRRVYVSGTTPVNGQDQVVSVVDIASRSRHGPLGTPQAPGLAASPDGSRLYVLTINPQTVKIVDTVTNSVINTVPLRLTNFGTTVKLSPDGRYVYFPRSSTTFATPGVMEVLDTTIETIVASPTIGVEPLHVGVSPNGAVVYAPGSRSRRVDRLNPLTHAAEGSTPLTKAASSVAFLPDSSRVRGRGRGAATLSVPVPAGETFSYAGVPGGTYTFTVRAVNITGVSAPSAPLTLTFPSACSGPPQEAVNFTVSRARFAAHGQLGSAGNRTGGVELRAQGDRCSQPRVASRWPHHQRERGAGHLQPVGAGREPMRVRGSNGTAVSDGAVERTSCRRAAVKARAQSTG